MSRNDHSYVKRRTALAKRWKAMAAPCHLCKGERGPILYDEDYRHPLSLTADHVDAVVSRVRLCGRGS